MNQYDWTLETLLSGANVDLLYLDLEKAFDKVDFGIILKKFKDLGICGKARSMARVLHDGEDPGS